MAPGPDLEVLVPDGGHEMPAPRASTPRIPRWVLIGLVVVVGIVVVAGPLRRNLARHELGWLERQWNRAGADDRERASIEVRLRQYLNVGEQDAVWAALASVYEDQRRREVALAHRLHDAVLVDLDLIHLRSAMVSALGHRATVLDRVAAWYAHPSAQSAPPLPADNGTAADNHRVAGKLAVAQRHLGDHRAPPAATAAPYLDAVRDLDHLGHWLDTPTGSVLLANNSNGAMVRLDIDASSQSATPITPVVGSAMSVGANLVYLSAGDAWSAPANGTGQPQLLFRGADTILAAGEPGAIWVQSGSRFAEIDAASGRVLLGPLTPPPYPQAATTAGLVLQRPDQSIEVWDPHTSQVRCHLRSPPVGTGQPVVVASRGDTLAWGASDGTLHLTDTAGCADRTVAGLALQNMSFNPAFAVGGFSPDGRTLGISTTAQPSAGSGTSTAVYLIDVASRTMRIVPGSHMPNVVVAAMAWAPDGRRLFWAVQGQPPGRGVIFTWQVGDQTAKGLRVLGLDLGPPLVVLPRT